MERNAQHTRTEASAPIPGLNPHLTEATDAKGSEACWAEAKTIPDIDTGGKAKAKSDSDSPINADKRGKEAMLLESEQQVNTNNRPDTARGEARRRAMMMLAAAIKEEENEEMVLKAITEEVEKTNARAEATRKACMEANVRARAAMEKEAAVKMILNENMEEEENANMKLKEIAEEGAKACKRAQAAKEACMAAQQRTKAAMEEEVEANKMLKKSMEAETNAKAKADIIRREADEARKRAQTTFQEEYEDSRRARTTRKDQEASIKSKEDLFYQGKGTCSIKGKESGSWDEGARLKLNAEMRTRGTMRTNARSDIEMGERTHDRDDDMPDFDPNGDPDVSKKLERRDRGSRTCRLGILTGMLLMFHCALIFLTYAFMTMPSKTECKEISTSNIWFEGCLWLGLLAVHTYFKYILDTCYNFQPDGRSEGAHVFLHTFSRVIFVGVLHTPMAEIRGKSQKTGNGVSNSRFG
uniref:Uncharacterized protein n=1 Tax=Oryza punctata TaxID=4537 RepID=A0A0E0M488_ORYPU